MCYTPYVVLNTMLYVPCNAPVLPCQELPECPFGYQSSLHKSVCCTMINHTCDTFCRFMWSQPDHTFHPSSCCQLGPTLPHKLLCPPPLPSPHIATPPPPCNPYMFQHPSAAIPCTSDLVWRHPGCMRARRALWKCPGAPDFPYAGTGRFQIPHPASA